MPRKKTVSDEDVIAAALNLLGEKGVSSFTLAEIAGRVGLSRATLIQRFGDRASILELIAKQAVEATRDYMSSFEVIQGRSGLWAFLEEIVRSMGSGKGFSVHLALAALEGQEPALRRYAYERYVLVQTAIAVRLPPMQDAEAAAGHLQAVIAGATMQWLATDHPNLSEYVLARVAWAFQKLFPDEGQAQEP